MCVAAVYISLLQKPSGPHLARHNTPTHPTPPTHQPGLQVSDDYTLKVMGALFTNNHNNDDPANDAAMVDVAGGTLYCHRCHFTENEGTAIKATGEDSLVGLSFSKFENNTAAEGLIKAVHSRGGFVSTSFIDNKVSSPEGGVVALRDGSLFLGRNALFRGNVGGDLLAIDSHFRIDKSLFKGSALNLPGLPALDGAQQKIMEGATQDEPPAPEEPLLNGDVVNRARRHHRRRLQEEELAQEVAEQTEAGPLAEEEGVSEDMVDEGVAVDEGDKPLEEAPTEEPLEDVEEEAPTEEEDDGLDDDLEEEEEEEAWEEELQQLQPLLDGQEGSAVRLYGDSSLRGFNNFFDDNQGPAILALDASNVTLGRPCFTNDAEGSGNGEARFVEAAAEDGDLTLWGACAFPSTTGNDVSEVRIAGMGRLR